MLVDMFCRRGHALVQNRLCMKKSRCAASFKPWSDEATILRSKCCSSVLPGPSLIKSLINNIFSKLQKKLALTTVKVLLNIKRCDGSDGKAALLKGPWFNP